MHGTRVRADVHRDGLPTDGEQARQVRFDGLHERGEGTRHAFEPFLAGIESRQPEQIADQHFHPLCVSRDDVQESLALLGGGVPEGFDVAADRRQRRAQFVRHVGDEVAADLIRPPQIGDVVQDHDGTARVGCVDGRRARDERGLRIAGPGQLDAFCRRALEGQRDLLRDRGLAHDFRIETAFGGRVDAEHPPRRVVGQLQAAMLVHHQHAFDHAREDGGQPRAIRLEAAQPSREVARHAVQQARGVTEFVLRIVGQGRCEIAGRVATGPFLDRRDPARQRNRHGPPEQRAGDGGDAQQQPDGARLQPRVIDGQHHGHCREGRDLHRGKRREDDLGAKFHEGSSRRYPNCLMVTIASDRKGNFSRRRRMCTSTVRVPPVY